MEAASERMNGPPELTPLNTRSLSVMSNVTRPALAVTHNCSSGCSRSSRRDCSVRFLFTFEITSLEPCVRSRNMLFDFFSHESKLLLCSQETAAQYSVPSDQPKENFLATKQWNSVCNLVLHLILSLHFLLAYFWNWEKNLEGFVFFNKN
jgi:hypothetical protein